MVDMMADMKKDNSARDLRRTRVGVVSSSKRMKTITVAIERRTRHPKYGKFQLRTGKLQVHDEKNEAKVGDQVEVMECRPISKTKNFRLVRVIRRGGETQ